MVCNHVHLLDFINLFWPGLELARLADLPEDVLTEAHRVANRLTELEENRKQSGEDNQITIRRKALLRVSRSLTKRVKGH